MKTPTSSRHISTALNSRMCISKAQINAAYGDATTQLPAGLTRPAHWRQSLDEQTAHLSATLAHGRSDLT